MKNSQVPIARSSGLVIQEVPDEVLVYDVDNDKAHCLNQTAAVIWKSCDGRNSVTDIARILGAKTGKTVTDDLVWLAIDQFNENNLLEKQVEARFAGQSRRDAIKKIGMAAMIALPIVASLAAPRNAMAAVFCACTFNTDCNIQAGCPSTTNCNQTTFICELG
ncbi:MAG TPA: hypothetical protein DEA22_05460 [Blastocatellia bacterium]|nr:hypothetical protein [Blastocatellia bacterium]